MRTPPLGPSDFEELRALATASAGARKQHRLHAVMLVAGGLSCRRVAGLFGASPRSVEYWVVRYKLYKNKGLSDKKKPGRPSRLSAEARERVAAALASPPLGVLAPGASWSGTALREYVSREFGVTLGVRQAQRLCARLGGR